MKSQFRLIILLLLGVLATSFAIFQSSYTGFFLIGSPAINTRFGQQVFNDLDIFFVGEPKNTNGGNVYAYDRTSQFPYDTIHIAELKPGDNFGASIHKNSDFMFVGAPEHVNPVTDSGNGVLYILELSGDEWLPIDSLSIVGSDSSSAKNSSFGHSVSSTDSYLLVGAPGENGDKGAAYVFIFENDTVRLQNRLALEANFDDAQFGTSVLIDSVFAYVSAPSYYGTGIIQIYKHSNDQWDYFTSIEAPENTVDFGAGFSRSQQKLVANGKNDISGIGVVFQYDFQASDSTWLLSREITSEGIDEDAQFGASVSIVDDIVAVGVPGSGELGATYFFYDHDSLWADGVIIEGDTTEGFGAELSMREDKIIIGAGEGVIGSATILDLDRPIVELSRDTLAFGLLDEGESSTLSFRIFNHGFVDLNVVNILGSEPLFDIDDRAFTVGKGEYHDVMVTLTSLDASVSYIDELVISFGNGGIANEKVYVGQYFPRLNVTIPADDFGAYPAYTENPGKIDIQISNTGYEDVTIDSVSFINSLANAPDNFTPFFEDRLILKPIILEPGENETLTLEFIPRELGTVSDSLRIRYEQLDSTISEFYAFEGFGSLPFAVLDSICNDGVCADTVLPSYVNVLFEIKDEKGLGLPIFSSDSLYLVEEDGDDASENPESDVNIDRSNELDFRILTVLMLDNSVSINSEELDSLKLAAEVLINNILDGQEIAIYTFSENTTQITDFTDNKDTLIAKINSIERGSATTDLYGAAITGASLWEDKQSLNGLTLGNMVLLTDGNDEAQKSTLQEAIDAIGDKNVITVGVGNQVDDVALSQLGTQEFLEAEDFEVLIKTFIDAQDIIYRFANSRYWMVYISPRRNDGIHDLAISIINNPNTNASTNRIEVEFFSNGFTSESAGIYVNRSIEDIDGIDTVAFNIPDSVVILNANTVFGEDNKIPFYEWSVSDYALKITVENDDGSRVRLTRMDQFSELFPVLIVEDTSNGFISEYPVMLNSKPSRFDLLTPENMVTVNGSIIEFTWTASSDTDPGDEVVYELNLFEREKDTTITGINTNSFSLNAEQFLKNDTQYDWNVTAKDDFGETTSTSTFGFFTPVTYNEPPSDFDLVRPEDGSTIDRRDITFGWQTSSDTEPLVYTLKVMDASGTIVYTSENPASSSVSVSLDELVLDESYSWNVDVTDGTSVVSSLSTFQFTTPAETPLSTQGEPGGVYLSPNFPNPVTDATVLRYGIPFEGKIEIVLLDMSGRKVATLVNRNHVSGDYQIELQRNQLNELSPGAVYICQMTVSGNGVTEKLISRMVIK